jgi:hypothetical protein
MKLKLPMVLFIITLTTLMSCKKDKDAPAPLVISIETISGSYKLAALTHKVDNLPEEDDMKNMDECEKDDILKFMPDKSFVGVDAGLKCSGDYTGDWDLPSTTQLVLNGTTWVLELYDGKVLKISRTVSGSSSIEVIKATLSRQN